jgi:hypothetical protein
MRVARWLVVVLVLAVVACVGCGKADKRRAPTDTSNSTDDVPTSVDDKTAAPARVSFVGKDGSDDWRKGRASVECGPECGRVYFDRSLRTTVTALGVPGTHVEAFGKIVDIPASGQASIDLDFSDLVAGLPTSDLEHGPELRVPIHVTSVDGATSESSVSLRGDYCALLTMLFASGVRSLPWDATAGSTAPTKHAVFVAPCTVIGSANTVGEIDRVVSRRLGEPKLASCGIYKGAHGTVEVRTAEQPVIVRVSDRRTGRMLAEHTFRPAPPECPSPPSMLDEDAATMIPAELDDRAVNAWLKSQL